VFIQFCWHTAMHIHLYTIYEYICIVTMELNICTYETNYVAELFLYFLYLLFIYFWGTGAWTQGLVLVFYYLSHYPSPLLLVFSPIGSPIFLHRLASNRNLCSLSSRDYTCYHAWPKISFLLRECSLTLSDHNNFHIFETYRKSKI
jgi:hypothetical protein